MARPWNVLIVIGTTIATAAVLLVICVISDGDQREDEDGGEAAHLRQAGPSGRRGTSPFPYR